MKKLNVLHLITSMNMGGGARGVRTYYRYTKNDLNNHVICYAAKGEKFDQFAAVCPTLSFAAGSQNFVKKYITKHKIDIVHLYGRGVMEDFEKKLLTDLKGQVKVVYTNIFGEYDPETDQLVDLYLFKSKHCLSQIFAWRAGIKISKSSGFYDRLRTIPNPVDLDYFSEIRPTAKQIRDYKKTLNIAGSELVIGKIGARKAIEKWSDLILYMLPEVLNKHPNTVMLIQGVPDSRVRWIGSFGDRVRILEETTSDVDLALMYNTLDIFTHASKIGEHSGNSINEAMYWGRPVIVNITPDKDNGQMEQVMPEKNGYFANDPQTYAKRVSELLSNETIRREFGNNSKSIILQNNNPSKLAEDIISCYQFITSGQSSLISISQDEIVKYNSSYPHQVAKFLPSQADLPVGYKISKLTWKVRDYVDHNYRKGK